eukprot:TRINITY_DN18267_c0_g1_i1.p1 TRINITY_DN18267_c0_g1~~TRINITY_DN18267_c0_g1_i1.p1  ORF type:complete len:128 (+),score=1.80 TRINITY_DN18267_c0_g1_i1:75-458(+)
MGMFYEWAQTFRDGYVQKINLTTTNYQQWPTKPDSIIHERALSREKLHINSQDIESPKDELHHKHHDFNLTTYSLVSTLFHVITLILKYAMILVLFTFNIGIIISTISGRAFGYLLFSRIRSNALPA